MFPDAPYIHIGGDEAKIALWKDCPDCTAWRDENGLANEKEMYSEYIRRITNMILERGRIPCVWEGFPKEGNHKIDKRVLVFPFESDYQTAEELLEGGFTVVNTSWKPLYIVTHTEHHWPQEEILSWQVNHWDN